VSDFPRLEKLGIKIHVSPVQHVLFADLESKLNTAQQEELNQRMNGQTCPVVEAGAAAYPWDVEAILERMASGKLTGSQLLWD
jgi:hypothetical protein